jgi:PAS domain S-box-containing protein
MLAGEINATNKNWPCRGKFYDATATSIMDAGGNIDRIVVLYNDITQRLQAEQKIRASEERYRELFENASDLIQITDQDGRLRYVNQSWLQTLGFNKQEVNTLSVFDLIHPECVGSCCERITKALQGDEVGKFETKFMAKDGRTVLLKGSISCKFEAGIPVSTQGIFQDITEEQRLEEEIFKNQKLESIGVLAGGIAHDFNNLLTAILGNISLAEAETAQDSAIAQRLGSAQKACAQAKHLTQQLLTFSKGGAPILKTTSIAELIRECASFTMRGSIIKCECLLSDDLWPVQADEGQISQVLHNLLINGIQAMPDGGIIRVRAENVSFAVSQLLLAPGRYVKVSVIDQGTGIAPELLPRIFDPYFST